MTIHQLRLDSDTPVYRRWTWWAQVVAWLLIWGGLSILILCAYWHYHTPQPMDEPVKLIAPIKIYMNDPRADVNAHGECP